MLITPLPCVTRINNKLTHPGVLNCNNTPMPFVTSLFLCTRGLGRKAKILDDLKVYCGCLCMGVV